MVVINIYLNDLIFQNNIWKLIKLFYTALILESRSGYTEILKLLLEQEGIDINTQRSYRICEIT